MATVGQFFETCALAAGLRSSDHDPANFVPRLILLRRKSHPITAITGISRVQLLLSFQPQVCRLTQRGATTCRFSSGSMLHVE